MKIFGKSLGEYIRLQKTILVLILIVGLLRLILSLSGVSVSVAQWLSISVVSLVGFVYYVLRIHPSGFGSYRHLLPLLVIQGIVGQAIIIAGIAIAIFTGQDNIFSVPEYSGGADGKTWFHAAMHVLIGAIVSPLVFWAIGSGLMFIIKKMSSGKTATARAS